jgi:hypothetical protein
MNIVGLVGIYGIALKGKELKIFILEPVVCVPDK